MKWVQLSDDRMFEVSRLWSVAVVKKDKRWHLFAHGAHCDLVPLSIYDSSVKAKVKLLYEVIKKALLDDSANRS